MLSSSATPTTAATLISLMIQMSLTPAQCEAWKQCHVPHPSTSLASTTGDHALLASRSSGASIYMKGTSSVLTSLTPTTAYIPIFIADDRSCPIQGYGSTNSTSYLILNKIPYAPLFPTNLLSINATTHALNYVALFFPFHCVFENLHTK